MNEYTIYWSNFRLMKSGNTTYKAYSESNAISQFKEDYSKDYDIVVIF